MSEKLQDNIHPSYRPLTDHVAIVTGAGHPRGIGRATAVKLARQGARVVVSDLASSESEKQNLHGVCSELQSISEGLALAVDVTAQDQIDACVSQVLEKWGRVDILFNNAGTPVGAGAFLELTEHEWDQSFRVNVLGAALFSRSVIPIMQSQGGGSIVNNASIAGVGAVPMMSAYTASKFGLVGLTKAIAAEFAPDMIRCNCVCPGMVDTRMGDLEVELLTPKGGSVEETRRTLAQEVPIGRWASPEEVADAVAFLAGPEARYITGAVVPVAGGLSPGL